MKQNIKVAKELVKLAKSLIANDIDEQTKVRLEEAEKSGKKYILHHKEGNLWRIMACRNIVTQYGIVEKGEFGGLIESERNLSQDGDCWVYDRAKIYGNAQVYGDASILDKAQVYDNAQVYGEAWVCDNAKVYGNAKIFGNAKIQYYAEIDYDVKDKEITE